MPINCYKENCVPNLTSIAHVIYTSIKTSSFIKNYPPSYTLRVSVTKWLRKYITCTGPMFLFLVTSAGYTYVVLVVEDLHLCLCVCDIFVRIEVE